MSVCLVVLSYSLSVLLSKDGKKTKLFAEREWDKKKLFYEDITMMKQNQYNGNYFQNEKVTRNIGGIIPCIDLVFLKICTFLLIFSSLDRLTCSGMEGHENRRNRRNNTWVVGAVGLVRPNRLCTVEKKRNVGRHVSQVQNVLKMYCGRAPPRTPLRSLQSSLRCIAGLLGPNRSGSQNDGELSKHNVILQLLNRPTVQLLDSWWRIPQQAD